MSLTPREQFNLSGGLPAPVIEALLDTVDSLPDTSAVKTYIKEARSPVSEDFLDTHLDKLNALAKRLRGDNRVELLSIIESLTDASLEVARAIEYSDEQLTSALGCL